MRVKQCKSSLINNNEINKLKNNYDINDNSKRLDDTKIKLQEARELWKEMKEKGIEFCKIIY